MSKGRNTADKRHHEASAAVHSTNVRIVHPRGVFYMVSTANRCRFCMGP